MLWKEIDGKLGGGGKGWRDEGKGGGIFLPLGGTVAS